MTKFGAADAMAHFMTLSEHRNVIKCAPRLAGVDSAEVQISSFCHVCSEHHALEARFSFFADAWRSVDNARYLSSVAQVTNVTLVSFCSDMESFHMMSGAADAFT